MAWRKSARFESSHDEYGLDLALFVHAEHQSILWWVHIEAHHITNLIDKVGILRKSEDFLAMSSAKARQMRPTGKLPGFISKVLS